MMAYIFFTKRQHFFDSLFHQMLKLKRSFQKCPFFGKISKISCGGEFSKLSNFDDVLTIICINLFDVVNLEFLSCVFETLQ